jgi:hypothetical protein
VSSDASKDPAGKVEAASAGQRSPLEAVLSEYFSNEELVSPYIVFRGTSSGVRQVVCDPVA